MTNKEIREAVELLKEQAKQQAAVSSSLDGYLNGLKQANAINETIANNIKIEAKVRAKIADAQARGDAVEEKNQTDILKILQQQTKELKIQGKVLDDNLKAANKTNMVMAKVGATMLKSLGSLPDLIQQGYGKIKGLGLFELDKSMKKTALSMGVLSKQGVSFTNGLKQGALYSNQLGISLDDLAKMQGDYANELGRNVILSQEGLKAMSEMAAASGLGAEGTSKMAADMDQQGLSAQRTGEFIEQTMNDSHKMGLNSSKVVKNISGNIRMLNRYNFKGGIKGLAKMAETVSKLGVDMEFAAGFADKLWDIEGAVDLSAQLQVMGGEWAKMADPFHLMYMARNDMEGLTEEIGNAAAASARFASDGSIQISTMEMSRLKKIAEETGIAYDDLVTAGKNAFKNQKIKGQIAFNMSDEEKEFISNVASFDKDGNASIMIDGKPKFVKQLTQMDYKIIQAQMIEKESMEERARGAQTFDDALTNTLNMFKVTLLPLIETMNKKLIPKIQKLVKRFEDEKWGEKIEKFASLVGGWISKFTGMLIDNPLTTAIGYLTAKGLSWMMEKAGWVMNGMALAQGFNMGAMGGGGLMGMGGKGGMMGMGGKGGMMGMGNMAKMTGVASGLLAAYNEYQTNDANGMATGENLGRTGITGVGAGLGGWGGAALGAEIGLVGGPIGAAIGALIGGAIGAWGGSELGGMGGDAIFGDDIHDGYSPSPNIADQINEKAGTKRSIIAQGMIRPIDNADSFLTKKDTGPVEKAFSNTGKANTVKHEFGNLTINGQLTVTTPGGGSVSVDLLKDPQFIRSLTKLIQVESKTVQNQIQKP